MYCVDVLFENIEVNFTDLMVLRQHQLSNYLILDSLFLLVLGCVFHGLLDHC